jgi:uncharacterized membrane protein YfcA
MTIFFHLLFAMASAFLAGGVNSIAGGGTLISFPILIALGLSSVTANATSTVAIWPGSIGSMWGFRREIKRIPLRLKILVIPAMIGGLFGAWLLRATPPGLFERLVPYLILFATLLFTIQASVQKRLQRFLTAGPRGGVWAAASFTAVFFVGVYGGYFGAGMSIMMLTAAAFMGMEDILEMSALTSLMSFCTNGVASALFIAAHMVVWPYVLGMMVTALLGGWAAARIARGVAKSTVRRFVICVGVMIGVVLILKTSHF